MVATSVVHLAERVLPEVPGPLVAPFAELLGTVAYAASSGARAAVRANLDVVTAGRATDSMVRRVFIEQSRNYLDIFRLPRIDPAELLASVTKHGWERFIEAHALGRGVIVASAHLGPISLVGQIFLAHGYETVLPVEAERSEIQRAVNRGRRALGLQLVSTDTPLAVVRALRQGKVFGLLADRAVTGVGERVPFFGRETLLPSVHIALGLRTGAPVIPAFSLHEGRTLVASFEPALKLLQTGDRDADVRAGMLQWSAALERYIRRAPEQWTVFERVWSAG